MTGKRRPLADQVIVMTGAMHGIGSATARLAAKQGARLLLAARDAAALDELAGDIWRSGGRVEALRVDGSVKEQVTALGRVALHHFGRVDTWVNIGESVLDVQNNDTSRGEFWNVVHGSITALGIMRHDGGTIVNLLFETAARHDIKRFTDALRTEVATDGVPISVTLVHTAMQNVDSAPEQVAQAILHAAAHAKRDVYAGGFAQVVDELISHALKRPRSRVRLPD